MNAPFEIDFGGLELSLRRFASAKGNVETTWNLNAPSDVVPLSRVPNGTRVGVQDRRDVHVTLLGGGSSSGHADSSEEEGSKCLREHRERCESVTGEGERGKGVCV